LQRINREDRQPFIFYLHPWEFDTDQPRISGAGWKSRFRHYLNLDKTEERFKKLIRDFAFAPVANKLSRVGAVDCSLCHTGDESRLLNHGLQ
jgi:hypothetical protein